MEGRLGTALGLKVIRDVGSLQYYPYLKKLLVCFIIIKSLPQFDFEVECTNLCC